MITIDDEATPEDAKVKKRKRADEDSETDLEKVIDYLNAEYMFQHNRITEERVFRKKQLAAGEKNDWALLEEEDLNTILIEMKLNRYKVSKEVLTMIIFSRLTKSVSPIADYLNGLSTRKPTGKSAFVALCKTITLANETEYRKSFERLLWRWLCANAACALGKKINDVCLVFIGGQGTGKTTWLNKLCSLNDYGYCGHIDPNTTNNETANLLAEKWLINIDDQLETIFGKDFNSLKSVISAPNVSNRKAYARQAKKRARIASFCASVNSTNFLTDTQNRRYLCFEIDKINWELSNAINYDDVWAEVTAALNAGERFAFDKDEMQALNQMNDQFLEVTAEHEFLSLTYKPGDENDPYAEILTRAEILKEITTTSGHMKLSGTKLGRALDRLGFEKKNRRRKGTPFPVLSYLVKNIRESTGNAFVEPEPEPELIAPF